MVRKVKVMHKYNWNIVVVVVVGRILQCDNGIAKETVILLEMMMITHIQDTAVDVSAHTQPRMMSHYHSWLAFLLFPWPIGASWGSIAPHADSDRPLLAPRI